MESDGHHPLTPVARQKATASYASAIVQEQPPARLQAIIPTVTPAAKAVNQAPITTDASNALAKVATYATPVNEQQTTLQELTTTANIHSTSLMELRDVCSTLMMTQQKMSENIATMNEGFNQKFIDMTSKMEL
jgi:septal ring factor EnvC (AmiA/AmiB activator)